jgi:hypothetical protein
MDKINSYRGQSTCCLEIILNMVAVREPSPTGKERRRIFRIESYSVVLLAGSMVSRKAIRVGQSRK